MKTVKTILFSLTFLFLSFTGYGFFLHPTANKNSIVKISVSVQKEGITKQFDTTFYGECDNEVKTYLSQWTPKSNAIEDAMIERMTELDKETQASKKRVVVIKEDATINGAPEKTDDFEEQTKSFYGDNYEQLDKTRILIQYFEKMASGELKKTTEQKNIYVTDKNEKAPDMNDVAAKMSAATNSNIIVMDTTITTKDGKTMQVKKLKTVEKNTSSSTTQKKENEAGTIGNTSIDVYPNPSKGKTRLDFSVSEKTTLTISMHDIQGKEVYKEILNSFSGKYSKEINLEKYGKGTYLLKIIGDKNVIGEKKFILE